MGTMIDEVRAAIDDVAEDRCGCEEGVRCRAHSIALDLGDRIAGSTLPEIREELENVAADYCRGRCTGAAPCSAHFTAQMILAKLDAIGRDREAEE